MSYGEQIDNLLAQMRFMAEAQAAAIDADKVSSGKSDSKPPPFVGKSLHSEGERILDGAISEMQKAIREARHTQAGELTPLQLDYWVIVANEGRSLRDVSERLGVSEATIAAIRERRGRAPATGKHRKGPQGRKPAGLTSD